MSWIDDILKSSLTVLLWLILAFVALWWLLRAKVSPVFWAGYALGSLYFFWVNAQNNRPDAIFTGAGGSIPTSDEWNAAMAGNSGLLAGDVYLNATW